MEAAFASLRHYQVTARIKERMQVEPEIAGQPENGRTVENRQEVQEHPKTAGDAGSPIPAIILPEPFLLEAKPAASHGQKVVNRRRGSESQMRLF